MLDAWSPEIERAAWIVGLAIAVHLAVVLVRRVVRGLMARTYPPPIQAKLRSVLGLAGSVAVFAIYFAAVGLVLAEFGVSMTAYFASTTIIGLAVGFGSQGLVQDVVTGLTVIATGLFDIGDMVEISGQTGVVEAIGMRFVTLRTGFGAEVRIPNRSIANVIRYPRDHVRCAVDVRLPEAAEPERVRALVAPAAAALRAKYPRLFRDEGTISERRLPDGDRFLRVELRVWPGRTAPVENELRPQIVARMKEQDPDFADWMVAVNLEVEEDAAGQAAPDPLAALQNLRFWRRSA